MAIWRLDATGRQSGNQPLPGQGQIDHNMRATMHLAKDTCAFCETQQTAQYGLLLSIQQYNLPAVAWLCLRNA